MLTPALVLTVIAVAALVHHRLPWYPLATAVATLCTALPAVLVFEVSGMARTGFMPFTLFVLLAFCLVVCALAGLPFWLWRWHRGIRMAKVPLPTGIPWTMFGGMLCGAASVVLPTLLARAQNDLIGTLLMALLILGYAGSLAASVGGTLFLAAAVIAGNPDPARTSPFRTGALLAAGVSAALVLATLVVPGEWAEAPRNRLLALQLNLALLLPAAAGWICGRRATARPPAPGGRRSKVLTADGTQSARAEEAEHK